MKKLCSYIGTAQAAQATYSFPFASLLKNMTSMQRNGSEKGKPPAPEPDRRLAQPFSGWTHEQMTAAIDKFIKNSKLEDYERYIRRGAFLAQSKAAFPERCERSDGLRLDDSERQYLDIENSSRRIDKFNQPWRLYALVGCCSLGAAVQGWYVDLTRQSMLALTDRTGMRLL
jgi:hypothetical protein